MRLGEVGTVSSEGNILIYYYTGSTCAAVCYYTEKIIGWFMIRRVGGLSWIYL